MSTRTVVLIAEPGNANNLGVILASSPASWGSVPLYQPANRVDWASNYSELSWAMSILGITDGGTPGSPGNALPSAFSIKARFEYRQSHTTSMRFQKPRWSNMSDLEVQSHIIEQAPWFGPGQAEPVADPITGVGDGVICTQATTGYNATTGIFANPIIVRRTLRHFPQGVRVNLSGSTFTGGTSPKLLIGLEVVGREN